MIIYFIFFCRHILFNSPFEGRNQSLSPPGVKFALIIFDTANRHGFSSLIITVTALFI